MYHDSYSQILEDDSTEARAREKRAFDQAIDLLTKAERLGVRSPEGAEALRFVERFWMFLLEDLANEANELPATLRASLISIGIWISKEIENIRKGAVTNFAGLVEINSIIRDGLR